MSAKRKFNSDALEAIHSSASALFKVGAIDKATMRDFDETCLAVTPTIAPRKQQRQSARVRPLPQHQRKHD